MSVDSIYNRRSIRKFKPDTLSRQQIEKILTAAANAPSGKNIQPWKFIVLGGSQKAEMLTAMEAGISREINGTPLLPKDKSSISDAVYTLKIMRQAPVIIVVLNPCDKTPFKSITPENHVTEIINTLSVGAAIQNMLLQAYDLGIGSLWIGNTFYAYTELCSWLNTDMQLTGAVALGYADESPHARPRKPADSIVEYRL